MADGCSVRRPGTLSVADFLPSPPNKPCTYVSPRLLGEGIEPFARQLPRNSAIMGVEFEPHLADVWLKRERELATTPLATAFEEVRLYRPTAYLPARASSRCDSYAQWWKPPRTGIGIALSKRNSKTRFTGFGPTVEPKYDSDGGG